MDNEKVYVLIRGYNQYARELLNQKYGIDLNGNIEMYYVDTLKHIKKFVRKPKLQ